MSSGSMSADERRQYRARFPCETCGTGYLNCAAFGVAGLKCCAGCAHPDRFAVAKPYSADELADMRAVAERRNQ